MSGGRKSSSSGNSDFVVVANRLPIDMERLPDGSVTWKRSPGGLVTALEPLLRRQRGAWIGWPGIVDGPEDPIVEDELQLYPVRLSAEDVRRVLRGVLQRHAVAAVSRRDRQADLPPRVVGPLRRRQPALRRGDVAGGRRGRHGVGAGLPAAAGSQDAADAAARPDDRVLPAHPVPAGRAVHAAAVAHRDHRRSAGRRPGRLPSARRRAELPVPVPAAGGREHVARLGRCAVPIRRGAAGLPHRQGGRLPDFHRFRRTGRQGHAIATSAGARSEIRAELGNPRKILLGVDRLDYTKGIDVRLKAFSELLAEGRAKRRRHRPGAAGDSQPGTGGQLPHPAQRHRAAGRPHQRRVRRGRPSRSCTTCTDRFRATS